MSSTLPSNASRIVSEWRPLICQDNLISKNATLSISSGLIALSSALLAFRLLNHAQSYHQFAVGFLAWSGESKSGEMLAALLFILLMPTAWLLLRWAIDKFTLVGVGRQALVLLQSVCVPGAIGVGRILLSPKIGEGALGWMALSLFLLAYWFLLSVAMANINARRARNVAAEETNLSIPLLPLFLIPTFAGFSLLGILVTINRGLLYNPIIPAWPVGFGIAAGLCIVLLFNRRSVVEVGWSGLWANGVVCSQIGIPFLAAGLIPTPYVQAEIIQRTAPVGPLLVLLVVTIGVVTVWDVSRRLRSTTQQVSKNISPFALLLCAWIIKDPFTQLPRISTDDWHFGEALIPFFSWYDFGAIPFANIMPVRGFISVTNAALGSLFFVGTAADISHSSAIIGLLFSALVFVPMHFTAGPLAGVLTVLALSNGGLPPLGQADYLFVAAFCIICFLAQKQLHPHSVMAWLFLSPLFILLAPGQAMLFMIATVPLVGYCIYKAGGLGVRRISLVFSGVGCALLLALVSPTGADIAQGIWHYFNDHASINVIGHGVPWGSYSAFGPAGPPRYQGYYPMVLELFRSSSLLVAAMLLTFWIGKLWRHRTIQLGGMSLNGINSADKLDAAISLSIVLTVIVFLPRVLGRIDPNMASRLGTLTLLVLGGLMPVVLRRYRNHTAIGLVVLLSAVIISGVNDASSTPLSTRALLIPKYVHAEAQGLIDGGKLGLSHVGFAQFERVHLDRLVLLKQSIDSLLPSGAPYYDMSNRNAHYVYLGRPIPAEWSSPYYLADERAQQRVVAELNSREVPLILLKADNVEHDGGTAALRAYWLYRFVLSYYMPFRLNGFIFAVRRDDAQKDSIKSFAALGRRQTIELFDEAFAVQDLRAIPISWGRSYSTLISRLTATQLQLEPSVDKDGTILLSPIRMLKSNNNAEGSTYDMLRLRLECDNPSKYNTHNTQLSWKNDIDRGSTIRHAKTEAFLSREEAYSGSIITGGSRFSSSSGTLLVPIGAYPSWMLSKFPSEIRLKFTNQACRVLEAELRQRAVPSIR